ncbi:ras-related GTP-binding protein [Trypanosoma conorhini]|uniref:Ras-related GTP-binding protein n=1 Tax=Trypanosoma conorhini TaxID=83891 RepID=A0A3R7KXM7_9TRYP|nr:ras-related GTP-binding protein [Trypanosoma conorhini]RNF03381.1 ras-related GTP-binding protein [Trypanosoma conorhini]
MAKTRPTHSSSASASASVAGGVEPRIKIISIGSLGVGKSCVIKRYCEGRFVAKYIPTIGIDYGVKRVGVRAPAHMSPAPPNFFVRVNFWDMSGSEEFLEIRNEFYYAAEGVLIVYDVTDAASFAALDAWVAEMQTYMNAARSGGGGGETVSARPAAKPPVVVVCANKVDDEVDGGRKRAVSEADGRRWAEGHGYKYFEVSACTGLHVAEMFETLFNDVVAAFM